jgi:hypothetical protein
MGTLLLPSLNTRSFLNIPSIGRQDALGMIQILHQQVVAAPGAIDRVAYAKCNIVQSPTEEQALGLDFQVLSNFPASTFDLEGDSSNFALLENLAQSHHEGVRGRRAFFIEDEETVNGQPRISVIFGTLVLYSNTRFTRQFWDEEASEVYHASLLLERATDRTHEDFRTRHPHEALPDEERGLNPLQALEVADIAIELRRLGNGNLLSVPKDPALLSLADRLDRVVENLGGVPKPENAAGTAAPLDVDKLIAQGKVVLKDSLTNVDKSVRLARNWLADKLSDLDKR